MWEKTAQKIIGFIPSDENIKTHVQNIESPKLKSNDQIVKRVQYFANRVSLGQNARFRCFVNIGHGLQAISIEMKGSVENKTDFDFKEDTFAVKELGYGFLTAPPVSEYQPASDSCRGRWGADLYYRETIHHMPYKGPFQATIRFPSIEYLAYSGTGGQTDMEVAINNIVMERLDAIATQFARQNNVRVTTVLTGVAFLIGFAYGASKK